MRRVPLPPGEVEAEAHRVARRISGATRRRRPALLVKAILGAYQRGMEAGRAAEEARTFLVTHGGRELGPAAVDELLHPLGKCSCGGEGRCSWCRRPCPRCGVATIDHGDECLLGEKHPDYDPQLGVVRPRWLCVDHEVEVTSDGERAFCSGCGGQPRRTRASCTPTGFLLSPSAE